MELKDVEEKISASLGEIKKGQESIKSEVNTKLEAAEKSFAEKSEELARRLDALEVESKHKFTEAAPEPNKAKDAFLKYIRYGEKGLNADEMKLMHTGDAGTGFFATPEISTEIVRGITHFSPMRQLCRVITINSKSYMYPTQTGHTNGAWVGELEPRVAQADLAYEMSEIPTEECYTFVQVSRQNLEDSTLNLEAEISMDFGRAFGLLEGTAFLSGSGIKQPQGLLKLDAAGEHALLLEEHSSADADNFTIDDLMDLKALLDPVYLPGAVWMMHPSTWNYIAKKKDAVGGQYLLQPRITEDLPDRLLGFPVVYNYELEPNDEIGGVYAAHDHPVLFGNFQRCYTIVDRTGIEFERFAESAQWKAGIVEFCAKRRVGGQVTDRHAVKALITHA
jgi:HK97 family phage major capsid protein